MHQINNIYSDNCLDNQPSLEELLALFPSDTETQADLNKVQVWYDSCLTPAINDFLYMHFPEVFQDKVDETSQKFREKVNKIQRQRYAPILASQQLSESSPLRKWSQNTRNPASNIDPIEIQEHISRVGLKNKYGSLFQDNVGRHVRSIIQMMAHYYEDLKHIDGFNLAEFLKFTIIHDIPELWSGDYPTHSKDDFKLKRFLDFQEAKVSQDMKSISAKRQGLDWSRLMKEINTKKTVTAKIFRFFDAVEPQQFLTDKLAENPEDNVKMKRLKDDLIQESIPRISKLLGELNMSDRDEKQLWAIFEEKIKPLRHSEDNNNSDYAIRIAA